MWSPSAVERFASFRAKTLSDTLAANKQAMTDLGKITEGIYSPVNTQTGNPQASQLPLTDRQKVEKWLDRIGADGEERVEVIVACMKDKDARAYYVKQYDTEIK